MGTGKKRQVFHKQETSTVCSKESGEEEVSSMEKGDEHSVFHENRKGAKCVQQEQEKSTLCIKEIGEEHNYGQWRKQEKNLHVPWNRRGAQMFSM
jgi:hypothetical protein